MRLTYDSNKKDMMDYFHKYCTLCDISYNSHLFSLWAKLWENEIKLPLKVFLNGYVRFETVKDQLFSLVTDSEEFTVNEIKYILKHLIS